MEGWTVSSSRAAKATINPIRNCIEKHFVEALKQNKKDLYKLAIGDLPPHTNVLQAIHKALESSEDIFDYGISYGAEVARRAIAEKFSTPDCPISADDVIMTTGCAGALEMCFSVLCERGSNLLLPAPCYCMYDCLAGFLGVDLKYYTVLVEGGWDVDLEELDKQVDSNTKAILVNNPGNPFGSVFSKETLRKIVGVARKHHLPIISDEAYADMVFDGYISHPLSSVAEEVPVLVCSCLSKRYHIPGWRVGWVIIRDRYGVLDNEIKPGLRQLATRNIGPSAVVQHAIPHIFKSIPESFFTESIATYQSNAQACCDILCPVEGLRPIKPSAPMHMVIDLDLTKFPDFEDDISFMKQLIIEQGVMCLPGSIFHRPSAVRIALIMPQDKLTIACNRIKEFCIEHCVKDKSTSSLE